MIMGIPDVILIAMFSALFSGIASYGAVRMKLAYMDRDVRRAQDSADGANKRIDSFLLDHIERRRTGKTN